MNKTLYIHIGTGKTGTTALQEFLHINSEALLINGVNYCQSGRTNNNHHLLCYNSNREKLNGVDVVNKHLEQLQKEIRDSNVLKHIISSENFPGLSQKEIDNLFAQLGSICNVEIVVYLRRQDEFLESWYTQIIKALNATQTIYQLMNHLKDEQIFDYLSLTNKWDVWAGKLHVRPYEKSQFINGNIFDDFMSVFGVKDISGFKKVKGLSNPSLSREQAFLKKEMFKFCNKKQNKILSKPINGFNFESSRFILSPNERQQIVDEFKLKNDTVAIKYLNKSHLFESSIVRDSLWYPPNLLQSGYLKKVISFLWVMQPTVLKDLEEPLVKYIIHTAGQREGREDSFDLLFLALFIRPNGPNIRAMIKKNIENQGNVRRN